MAREPDDAFVLAPNDPTARGWVAVREERFDSLTMWELEGAAQGWAVKVQPPAQAVPFGQRGTFIDTFTLDGDRSTGRLTSAAFEVRGEVITLRVGGGMGAQTSVSLLVDGAVVRQATGCNSERLGLRAWNVTEFKGRTARLRIDDQAKAAGDTCWWMTWSSGRSPDVIRSARARPSAHSAQRPSG